MPTPKLSKIIIEAAIDGFEAQKARINIQIAALRAMLSGEPTAIAEAKPGGKRRKFSPAALQRMREAQQARWARVRGETAVAAPAIKVAKTAKPKRKMSAAGRANIVAALKKRWAAKKAAAKK